jgi:glycosyltransferase involved in cell wall biosynthesis
VGDTIREGRLVPHLLFYENGVAPTSRSVREFSTLRRLGWDITVAHHPRVTAEVEALGVQSLTMDVPPVNPYHQRLTAELTQLNAHTDELNLQVDELVAQIHAARAAIRAPLTEQRDALTVTINRLANRVRALRGGREKGPEAAARAQLEKAKAERTAIGERMRAVAAQAREELDAVKRQRSAIAAETRALHAARRTPTPLTGGAKFGDLARLEAHWQDAAQILATVHADLFWAADLDSLPAVIWASEAAAGSPPVILDCHEMWTELEYMPELYRYGWRMIADRFVPKADAVFAVSEPILRSLAEDHGARRTLLVPNLAMPGPDPANRLRSVLGLAPHIPLVIHIGHLGYGRDPNYACVLEMLSDLPGVHAAYVGTTDEGIVAEIQAAAAVRGVAQRLQFVPPVPLEQLIGFVTEADVSLFMYDALRSRDNAYAMPNKLFDSLAAGVPVIAPDGTIAAEFLEAEGLGHRFQLGVPGQLSTAVQNVLDDPGPRQRARARAAEFTWTQIEPALAAIVDEVLTAHAARASAALPAADEHIGANAAIESI